LAAWFCYNSIYKTQITECHFSADVRANFSHYRAATFGGKMNRDTRDNEASREMSKNSRISGKMAFRNL